MNSTLEAETPCATAGVPPPNFDLLAGHYRWMEWITFGPFLMRCRAAFLPRLTSARRALVLGDGDGRFTARLLRQNSQVHIDAIDLSPAMLHSLAQKAGPHAGRVLTHRADVRQWQPAGAQYDLVVTHFFLDCLTTEEVRSLAMRMRNSTSPGALWIVSEFAEPEGWFGRLVARPVIGFLYRAFGILTGLAVRELPDHQAALRQAGLTLVERRTFLRGMLVAETWRMPAKPSTIA